jgi:DNA-directed RNA polymerase alpha subunit
MSSKSDIKFKVTNYIKERTMSQNSRLDFTIEGLMLSPVIINSLRRIILSEIPIYAIPEENIKIITNTSSAVVDNNHMALRLSMFPIMNIKNDRETLKMVSALKSKTVPLEYRASEKVNGLHFNLDYTNTTTDIVNVTTDDAEFYFEGKRVEPRKMFPLPALIVKLKPKQQLRFESFAHLDIKNNNVAFAPCSVCTYNYNEDNEHKFDISIESRNQLPEHEIVWRGCQRLIDRLGEINAIFQAKEIDDSEINEILFEGENFTMVNLINDAIQRHPHIMFSGCAMNHLLIEEAVIKYQKTPKGNIKQIFNDIITQLIDIFKLIQKQIETIK